MSPGSPAGKPVMLCYGTRPQVIKASVVRRALGREFKVLAIDSGQHYDYELNGLLYRELDVPPPEYYLEVGSGSHAEQTAAILTRTEHLINDARPAAVIVIGDTNSTLGAALAAAKCRVPVVHVEAGLRAADGLMAEELNRRVVDACARVLCTPCASATDRVRREHPDAMVVETGDVARDVLLAALPKVPSSVDTPAEPYVYATLHRAELTDDLALLKTVLATLAALTMPVVLAVHPRTAARMAGLDRMRRFGDGLQVRRAVGYLESLALIQQASAVVTDSGGVQREAYWLGVPCLTLRCETEWVETVEAGANRIVPPRAHAQLAGAVREAVERPRTWDRDAYGTGGTGERIADAVGGLLHS